MNYIKRLLLETEQRDNKLLRKYACAIANNRCETYICLTPKKGYRLPTIMKARDFINQLDEAGVVPVFSVWEESHTYTYHPGRVSTSVHKKLYVYPPKALTPLGVFDQITAYNPVQKIVDDYETEL